MTYCLRSIDHGDFSVTGTTLDHTERVDINSKRAAIDSRNPDINQR